MKLEYFAITCFALTPALWIACTEEPNGCENAKTSIEKQIKDKLVAQFGPAVLASPPKKGFDLLVWVLPLAGVAAGAAVLGLLAWRWSRRRGGAEPVDAAAGPLDPELERLLDEELARFER